LLHRATHELHLYPFLPLNLVGFNIMSGKHLAFKGVTIHGGEYTSGEHQNFLKLRENNKLMPNRRENSHGIRIYDTEDGRTAPNHLWIS
jgi:hypothetical protein